MVWADRALPNTRSQRERPRADGELPLDRSNEPSTRKAAGKAEHDQPLLPASIKMLHSMY
jgi:hypothetical protein